MLQVNQLSIGFSSKVVASDITIHLNSGQLTALIGVNGAGKSTLLRTIAGLQPVLKGDISVGNQQITHLPATERAKHISIVLTEKIAGLKLSVQDVIATGRHPYTNWLGTLTKTDRQKIQESASLLEISDWLSRPVGELSDGQLQKVMIARAVAQDTPVILLDEPATHLDLPNKAILYKTLKKLCRLGKTILFSTHDVEAALQIADGIVMISQQQTQQLSTPDFIAGDLPNQLFDGDVVEFDRNSVKFIFKNW